jgi:hypothetical protein
MPNLLTSLFREIKATMGIFEPAGDQTYGLLAEFSDPGALLHAAQDVRKAGYKRFDTHSPFPIHGMDRAMGLGQSKLGIIVFFGGTVVGCALGIWLQWWTSAIDYPLNISGKPFYSVWPAMPIIFELTILFSALVAVAGMLALNGLPRPYNPLFYSDRFRKATDDGFFLHIAASDPDFDMDATRELLSDLGALHVEVLEDRGSTTVPDEDPAATPAPSVA